MRNFGTYGDDWREISAAFRRKKGYRCANCGRIGTAYTTETHHIIPLSKGGKNVESNFKCVHRETCHAKEHPHLFSSKFKTAPRPPKRPRLRIR